MVTLPWRFRWPCQCCYQPPESPILLHNQDPHASTSMLVWILSAFNLVTGFHPGKIGIKPDALTRQWDIYLKEGNSNYATLNPQNYRPMFTSKQWALSLWATTLSIPVLRGSLIMDEEQLFSNIKSHLWDNPISTAHLDNQSDPKWTVTPDGLLCYSIEYMFLTMAIFDSMFCNTHMTIRLQVILVRPRHYMQSACNMPGLDFRTLSKTTANRAPPVPTQNLCTTDRMDSSNSSRVLRSLGIQFPWIS